MIYPSSGSIFRKAAVAKSVCTFLKGTAEVQAITSANVKCTSTGNAVGCASAEAAASAWATASASAHVKAVATAINNCKCQDKEAFAAAVAGGQAEAFVKFIKAEVSSKAAGEVCVKSEGPGETATAEVNVVAKCIEKKYANIMLRALAKAFIAGKCGDLKATAEIEALAAIDITDDSKC
jgi:hypothetical protein